MLTREMLQADTALSGLSDEQISSIVTMSQNDENRVIGLRIGEIYRQMDSTIASATGIQRSGDEKTYLYLERAAKELKSKLDASSGLQTEVESLRAAKAKLEEELSKGGSEETRRMLDQIKAELAQTKDQYNTLKDKHEKSEVEHQRSLLAMKIDNEVRNSLGGIKFSKDLPEAVTKVLMSQTIEKVKGMNPDFIDDGQGGKRLVFRGADGAVMNNPQNKLNPYTASELIAKELEGLGVIEKSGKGAGSSGGSGKANMDLSAARTKSEAHDIIKQNLMSKGLVVGTREYQEAFDKAYTEGNVSSLPMV